MITDIATFLASFAASIFYTSYMQAANQSKPVLASLWASITMLLVCAAIIGIIDKNASMIAMMLGCFIGTWLGVKIK
jgi:hypothetical protein